MFIEETLEVPFKYQHLSYNTIIGIYSLIAQCLPLALAFTIWSLDIPYNKTRPLGSTIISLFDKNLKLREGKYNLLIWPDRLPDTSVNSLTPGNF